MTDAIHDLVQVVVETKSEKIPGEAIELAKTFILDTVGVGLAGTQAPGIRESFQLVYGWGGAGESTVIRNKQKLPAPKAALLNSMITHALDFDDTLDQSPLHAYTTVLPAVLATAEAVGNVSGKEVLAAVVLGVDATCRLALACKTPLSWVRTATCGAFGAALASGRVLGLTGAQLVHACGIVYSRVSGNAQCLQDGGLVKRMQPAFSCEAGVTSAFMANQGITGSWRVLEGSFGFFNLYERGNYDRDEIYDGLGEQFRGSLLSIKPYPSCRMTHSAIDGALKVAGAHQVKCDEIHSVTVYVSSMVKEMVGAAFEIRRSPQVDAQFSIPYTVATALLTGNVTLKDLEENAIRDALRYDMTKKVFVVADDALEARDMLTARVVLVLKDGAEHEHRVEYPLGNPRKPLSMEQVQAKFFMCGESGGCASEYLAGLIEALTRLDVIAVDELTKLLRHDHYVQNVK